MKLVLVQPALAFDSNGNNARTIRDLLLPLAGRLAAEDVVLLPEHYDWRPARADYETSVRDLAVELGCHVVGGSHHDVRDGVRVNSGIAVDSTGALVSVYEKLRPYATERAHVTEGRRFGEFRIGERSVLVLICADFWFSDVFYRARDLPDLVLVPALSVTRKPTPDYSRALWQHLSVSRAYEFGAYVGVSDWAHVPNAPSASGVAGLADPTPSDPSVLFRPISRAVEIFELDFAALDEFRKDRMERGFFWKPVPERG